MKLYSEVAGSQVETVIPVITMKQGLFDLKIRTFLDACKNGTPAPVPSSQILYNQAIIDGIAKSAALGKEIEVEIPEL
jgi:predicted dehydrogenase